MLNLENPIPKATVNPGNGFWIYAREQKVLVPFRRSGRGLLTLLADLTKLSGSFMSCLKWINTFAYGGQSGTVDIIEKPIPGFSVKSEDNGNGLGDEEKKAFIASLGDYGMSLPDIVRASNKLEQHEWENGNSWLHIRGVMVADVLTIEVEVVHYLHIAYRHTRPGETRIAAICKNWEFSENRIEWIEVPVSRIGKKFNWRVTNGGRNFETVVHNPIELDEGEWYGTPWILSEMDWMYSEYLGGDLRVKVDGSEQVSKVGFAFQQEQVDDDFCEKCDEGDLLDKEGEKTGKACECTKNRKHPFEEKMDVLREITTRKGKKPSSFFGFEYAGENAPTMYEIGVNRDTNWFKEGLDRAAGKIHKKMGVPRELAYDQQAKSGIGTNTLINLYLIANCGTVEPTQHARENYWSHVFNELFGLLGREDLKKYGIRFNDKITPLVEALAKANGKDDGKKPDDTE